jgi:hypothetical protein
MEAKKLNNVLNGFDFRLLDNPEFKEDSVREEILVPIIKGLGYSANKPYQIIRSRKLLHPFVSIGSQRKNIHIVPDYLFEVNDKPAWVLDAKAPSESILKSAHVEQAYSYAIHSEVRVKYFALCNGREFALYSIYETEPVLHFPLYSIPLHWGELKRHIAPDIVLSGEPMPLFKDFGLHLKRLGFDSFEHMIFPGVPVMNIGQLDPDKFSLSGCINLEEGKYVVTFDFGIDVFEQFKGKIPERAIEILSQRDVNGPRHTVQFADMAYLINIDCKIGNQLEENEDEMFLPLWINKLV